MAAHVPSRATATLDQIAHEQAQPILALIEKMRAAVGKPKRVFVSPKLDAAIAKRVAELSDNDLKTASVIKEKKKRYEQYAVIKQAIVAKLTEELGAEKFLASEKLIKGEIEHRKAPGVL